MTAARSSQSLLRRSAPAIVGVAAAAALVAAEPSLLAGSIRSPRAWALTAVVALVVVVGGRFAGRRFGPVAGAATRAVPLALVAWFVVVPALRQTTLDEALPVDAAAPPARPTPAAGDAAPGPAPDAGPSAGQITAGTFEGIGHHATGSVSVHRLADGSHVVRFDDIDVRGAPDPVLYLVPGRDQRTRDGGTEAGALRATKGSFNQAVPAGFDLTGDFTVFVWCEAFTTPIAFATQTPL